MGILESIFGIWENEFFYSYKLYFSYICAHVRGPAQVIYLSLLASSEMGLKLLSSIYVGQHFMSRNKFFFLSFSRSPMSIIKEKNSNFVVILKYFFKTSPTLEVDL